MVDNLVITGFIFSKHSDIFCLHKKIAFRLKAINNTILVYNIYWDFLYDSKCNYYVFVIFSTAVQ